MDPCVNSVLKDCSKSIHSSCIAAALLLASAFLFALPAHAGWSASPVEVYSTSHECPQVAAASDAAHGAVVVWQETTTGALGVLRAQHLLAGGDVDPAWGGPVWVSDTALVRSVLVALTDGTGGAYVSWLEGLDVYLTHIDANGARSAGWPARGRRLGSQYDAAQRPSVLVDGAGGIYVAWHQASDPWPTYVYLMLAHLGASNGAADGFPVSGIRAIGTTSDEQEWVCTSAIDLAPDHGLWVAWGTSVRTEADPLPGDFRLLRLTPAGLPLPGWDAHGVSIGTFNSDRLEFSDAGWTLFPAMSLVGVASDGAGGAFVDRGDVQGYDPVVTPRLMHYDANGALAGGWPAGGVLICRPFGVPGSISRDMGYGASLRALPDGVGGVYASYAGLFATDSPPAVRFDHYGAAATRLAGGAGADLPDFEDVTQSGDGGLLTASCRAWGPYSAWEAPAYISCGLSNAGSYYAWHPEAVQHWYGDVGAAATGDGGAIFCWSQLLESQGIFAVRLEASGLAGVPRTHAVVAPGLALRFAPGVGVHVDAGFAAAGAVRLTLTDVAGRAVARERFTAGTGEREWTLAGTASLPAGLYFARIEHASGALTGRVIVTH